jgi:hypothetical protein
LRGCVEVLHRLIGPAQGTHFGRLRGRGGRVG